MFQVNLHHTPLRMGLFSVVIAGLLSACQGPTTVIGRTAGPSAANVGVAAPNNAATVAARPQIIIKFRKGLLAAEIMSFRNTYGLRNVGTIPELGVYVEEVVSERSVADLLRELQASPLVEYAEVNQQVTLP